MIHLWWPRPYIHLQGTNQYEIHVSGKWQHEQLTKEANKAEVNQDSAFAIYSASPHEHDDEKRRNAKVDFEFHRGNCSPDVVGIQLRLLLIRTQYDSDNARNGNDNAPKIANSKLFVKHGGCNDAVGYQRNDSERRDDGGRRKAIR